MVDSWPVCNCFDERGRTPAAATEPEPAFGGSVSYAAKGGLVAPEGLSTPDFSRSLHPRLRRYLPQARQLRDGPRLHEHWTSRADSLAPGDEYNLVDEFAEMIGIRGWYGWIPDVG